MANPDVPKNQHVVMMTTGMDRAEYDSILDRVRGLLGDNAELRRTFFFGDFRGFSIEAPSSVMNLIRAIPGIELVEDNNVAHAHQVGVRQVQLDTGYALDRISHRTNFINQSFRAVPEFAYFLPDGKGTTIYVIDSGVYLNHHEFQGRARFGVNYAPPNVLGNPNNGFDYNGHGTCVASCAAGALYGVAKFAEIVDVRILNDNGTTFVENEIAGIEFAVQDAERRGNRGLSVLNMSFGGDSTFHTQIVNFAVESGIRAGFFTSIAAGNSGINAEAITPANVPSACTVGATDPFDNTAEFSNFGQLIDIWAPGVEVRCAGNTSPNAMIRNSGTSFSAPFTAGVAAYLKSLSTFYSNMSPQGLCHHLAVFGTHGAINFRPRDRPSGPNIILNDLQGQQ